MIIYISYIDRRCLRNKDISLALERGQCLKSYAQEEACFTVEYFT